MKMQVLKTKKTYTEQINECATWEEVVALKNPDAERTSVLTLADPAWIESFSNEHSLYADEVIDEEEEMVSDYDLLLKEIHQILTPEEIQIYLLDAEESGSLRWIAKKIGKSHEYTRTKLISIKQKLKQLLSDKWRY